MDVRMSRSSCGEPGGAGRHWRSVRPGVRAVAAAAVAVGIVGFGGWGGASRAGGAGGPGEGPRASEAGSREDFIRRFRQGLKADDDRLIALAKKVFEEPDSPEALQDRIVDQRMTVASAEARYLNAKLSREIAEIAVKEYELGVAVQDVLTADGEIRLAKNDLERGRDMVEVAKERHARIKEVADDRTAYGRMVNYDTADRIVVAVLEVEKRKLALEQAEGKKKILEEFIKPKRIKELQSEASKAHSDELARRAAWELEKARLEKMQQALKSPWPASPAGKRPMTLLERAIPIQEQLHARLDQLASGPNSNEALQKEIAAQANDLEAIIEEAEAADSANEFARLKSRLRRAGGP